ncbi:hypothetical protein K3495_g11241 [Podosphaera aphanis]|nr:hypothetical protein K3495_g11241 [Podosphaera aphanis]
MSSANVWNTLRYCWIDAYQGPLEYIVHDAGTNFVFKEFQQLAKSMAITTKEVPVEARNSVGKVERYHAPLRRAYDILNNELHGEKITKDMILQMAQKAVNDSADPDGITLTLLVFGAYPRMIDLDPPTLSIQKCAKAIHSATEEVRKLLAIRQIRYALATRNGPNTLPTLYLPLNSPVRVWRENKGWQGPYRLSGTDGETCTVKLPHGPVKFRATVVKPYLEEDKEIKDHRIENNPVQKQIYDQSYKNINQDQQITFNDNKVN